MRPAIGISWNVSPVTFPVQKDWAPLRLHGSLRRNNAAAGLSQSKRTGLHCDTTPLYVNHWIHRTFPVQKDWAPLRPASSSGPTHWPNTFPVQKDWAPLRLVGLATKSATPRPFPVQKDWAPLRPILSSLGSSGGSGAFPVQKDWAPLRRIDGCNGKEGPLELSQSKRTGLHCDHCFAV